MARMPIVYSDRPRLVELANNLYRLDLPMPEAIGPSNSYIFKATGENGLVRSLIIDAGCDEPETFEAYDYALSELEIPWNSIDVFITHFHWDHCAGLSQIWRPEMTVYGGIPSYELRGTPVMSATEIGQIERTVSKNHNVGNYYDPAYWEPMTRSGSFKGNITVLHEGDVLSVGGYNLQVLETPGHDLHHLCLYDKDDGVFVGGDQVLHTGYPPVMTETEENQLELLLKTNRRLEKLNAQLVLSGHGAEGHNLSERCAKIEDHYQRQVNSFQKVCDLGVSDPGELAYLSTQAPKRTTWENRTIFGRRSLLAQTMAYLKYLVDKGELPDRYHVTPLR